MKNNRLLVRHCLRCGRAGALGQILTALVLLGGSIIGTRLLAREEIHSHLERQAVSRLQMPGTSAAHLPQLLSQTGAFRDVRALAPSAGLLAYELNLPFWADGAGKERWLSLPPGTKIGFARTGEWTFPAGTVLVKHFELATNEARPELRRRLETRLLVRDLNGGVYGVSYKWRADNSDAELLATNYTENILIQSASGTRTQTWYYPSREDCLTCHTEKNKGVLGLNTRQLNRPIATALGKTENQLAAWHRRGLFEPGFTETELNQFDQLAAPGDLSRSLEDRARSYLDANCSHCHRPGGTVATFDARYDTPLEKQNLIKARPLIDEGIDGARIVAPNDIWRSILYLRINRLDGVRMPPLAHNLRDESAIGLLREWIGSLGGPPVLAPPEIAPREAKSNRPVTITLTSADPEAVIHYTLDGSVPTAADPQYQHPFTLSATTILRAKCFRAGFTKSITSSAVFNFEN